MSYVGSRHSLAESNPLRSVPFMRTRAEVFGPAPLEAAQIKLAQLRSYMPDLIEGLTYACKTVLAEANQMPKPTRRRWQGIAMRHVNAARARVRSCLKDISAAEVALLALVH